MTSLNLAPLDATKLGARRGQPPIVIDGGGGYGYGIDLAHSGQLINIEQHYISRWLLEESPTVAVCAEVVRRLFRPLRVELRRPDGRPVERHPLLPLLNSRPNPIQSASEFMGQIAEELVYGGECVIRVYRSRGGMPTMLQVWPYHQVNTVMDGDRVRYTWTKTSARDEVLNDPRSPEICHVRMTFDHHRVCRSVSPWRGMASEVRASTWASQYRAEYFRQGGSPRLVAVIPRDKEIGNRGPVDLEKMREKLLAFWRAVKAGVSTWLGGETRAMPEGVMPHDLGPQNTADPVLTGPARAIDEKIAAVVGLPVIMLGNMERATYSNARQQMTVVVRDAIRPRLDAFLSAVTRDLLVPAGGVSATLEPVVDTDELVRDEASVFNKIQLSRVNSGVITPNEARDAFGLPPIDGGNQLAGDHLDAFPDDDEGDDDETPGEPENPESADALEK